MTRDELNHILIIDDEKRMYFNPEKTRGKWKATIDEMLSRLQVDKRKK